MTLTTQSDASCARGDAGGWGAHGGDQPSLRAREPAQRGTEHPENCVEVRRGRERGGNRKGIPGRNQLMQRSRCGRDHGAFSPKWKCGLGVWVGGLARAKAKDRLECGRGSHGEAEAEKDHNPTCLVLQLQQELPGPSCSTTRSFCPPPGFPTVSACEFPETSQPQPLYLPVGNA